MINLICKMMMVGSYLIKLRVKLIAKRIHHKLNYVMRDVL